MFVNSTENGSNKSEKVTDVEFSKHILSVSDYINAKRNHALKNLNL